MENSLSQEYESSLREYLSQPAESGLQRSYEIGRNAISAGLGVLDLVTMYREAFIKALNELDVPEDVIRISELATVFFTESLSTFEITHRGFQETNVKLQTLTRDLEKRVEERTRSLEASNAELEQFAYIISHDLQEPLRTISSFLELLQVRYGGRLDQNAKEFIGYAIDGANRLKTMIDDLLLYSRVGTRGTPFTSVDMNNVFTIVTNELGIAISESDAEISHESLPAINADFTQMVQLLENLIGNAIKFRGKDMPQVAVHARDDDDEWIFSVADNGIGIEQIYKERIFNIFQRLHTRTEYPGTGIGLAICKRIVDRHGGRIWFDSEPGKGSVFYFTLPKGEPAADPPES